MSTLRFRDFGATSGGASVVDRARIITMSPQHRRFLENLLVEFRRAEAPDRAAMIQHLERALARGTITGNPDAQGDDAEPGSTA